MDEDTWNSLEFDIIFCHLVYNIKQINHRVPKILTDQKIPKENLDKTPTFNALQQARANEI
jgi:hypothetical protein